MKKSPQYKAINGLSYKVVGNILSSETKHKFAHEFFYRKIIILKNQEGLKNSPVYNAESPIGNFQMVVFSAAKCSEKDANTVLWAKEDGLVCPGCRPFKTGRDCFELGARHELILPFLGFWVTDLRNRILPPKEGYPTYIYHDARSRDVIYYSTREIETLPIPLNVKCNDRVEIFLLVPRVCHQKKLFYLWQYRLLDRFISKEVFNNRCHTCGSNNIDMNPSMSPRSYIFALPTILKSLKGMKLRKRLDDEVSKHAHIFIETTQKFFCNNCREYSFLFQKVDFPEMLNIERKGLCSNCYMPVEHLIEGNTMLKCSHCGSLTPLYEKFSRKDISEKLE